MKNLNLTEEARQARNAYQRKYRKENRDKIREIENRYWENKAKKAMEKPNCGAQLMEDD